MSQASKNFETFKPFVAKRSVSIAENGANAKEIQILHDTGASKSLLAKGSDLVELSEPSATGETVVVEQGGFFVPLYKVFLKSDLMSGLITVGA